MKYVRLKCGLMFIRMLIVKSDIFKYGKSELRANKS